eukprot:gb/GECH01014892.1/.p1 GENE.gb/GECH01014892.1/~~gb/GECH01014892.1/.p1  ORF type:complete len:302 (+),score=76.75 gb/GECH01014892.1/:1-906(+)
MSSNEPSPQTHQLTWLQPDETADALLRRIRIRPLRTKQTPIDNFIKEGLIGGDLLEVNGPSQSGKTELCMAIVAQCILPYKFESVVFGGEARPAVWLDTDGHFHVLRFVTILENRIAMGVAAALQKSASDMTDQEIQGVFGGEDSYFHFILQCLSRLSIHMCTSPFQTWATLKAIQLKSMNHDNEDVNNNNNANTNSETKLNTDEPPFRMIVLDSMSAFAKASRGDIDRMSRSLEQVATDVRITALFTTSRRHQPLLPVYRIQIEPTRRKNKAMLETLRGENRGNKSEFFFTIQDHGIVYN